MNTNDERMATAWRWRRESFDWPLAAGLARLQAADQLLAEVERDALAKARLRDVAEAMHLRANVAIDRGKPGMAERLWKESVRLCETLGDDLMLAHKVRHLGDLARLRGRDADALACYERAAALHRAHPPESAAERLDFGNLMVRLATVRQVRGEHHAALAGWQAARACYAALDLAAGVADCDAHIAALT